MKVIGTTETIKPNEVDKKYGYILGVDGYMRIEEIMDILGVSRWTVDKRCQQGIYRKFRDGAIVRICRKSFMDQCRKSEV